MKNLVNFRNIFLTNESNEPKIPYLIASLLAFCITKVSLILDFISSPFQGLVLFLIVFSFINRTIVKKDAGIFVILKESITWILIGFILIYMMSILVRIV
jgi:hypothetical protein